MSTDDRKWEIIESEYLIRRPWLTARRDRVKLPTGVEIPEYYILEYPDWVNVIAITKEGKFVLVRQYRHGIKETRYEICAGVCKEIDFLACLQYRKLCRRKHTTCNKAQTIFLILLSLRNDFTDSFLYQLDKPNKNQHIAYIKSSMKSRQFKRYGNSRICCSHYIFYKP